VIGMAIAYAVAGVAAAYSGSLLAAALQTPGCWRVRADIRAAGAVDVRPL